LSWKKGLKGKAKGGEIKPSKKAPSLNEEVGKGGRQSGQRVTDPEGEGEDDLASYIEREKQKMGSREEEQPEEEQSSFRDQSEQKYPDEDDEQPEQASREYDEDELENRFNQGEEMAEQDAVGEGGESASGELGEGVAKAASSAVDDAAGAAGEAAEGVASAAADAVGGAASAATDAVAGGLEAAGTALDSTGVLAPIGFLLNIGGLFATAFGVYEAADTIAKEIRGPTKEDIPSVPVPNQPKTMAQKGILVTPHFNSLDTYGSVSTSW